MATPGRSYCQKHYLEQKRRNERKRDRKRGESDYCHRTRDLTSDEAEDEEDYDDDYNDVEEEEEWCVEEKKGGSKNNKRKIRGGEEDVDEAYYMNQVLPREYERVKSLHNLDVGKGKSSRIVDRRVGDQRWTYVDSVSSGSTAVDHGSALMGDLCVGKKTTLTYRRKQDYGFEPPPVSRTN